ncbi:hypothetical protein VU12_03035 [Desulfobulbus sp. US4]|nr:hypothetical protein [Desulfobulbus sp. US4]
MSVKFNLEPTPINRDLRMEVLEYALKLEANINTLLLDILDIPNKETKSLSGKGGSLSFKNKIDLLLDLGVLEKNDYSQLLPLMEFRNKFLHDLHCNSFETALSLFGGDKNNVIVKLLSGELLKDKNKKQKILAGYNLKDEEEREVLCQEAYSQLFDRTVGIVTDKITLFEKEYDERIGTLRALHKSGDFFRKTSSHLITKMFSFCNGKEEYTEIVAFLNTELSSITTPEECKKHTEILADSSWISNFTPKKRQE